MVLAKALRAAGTGGLDAAVATYQRIRRPRVETNTATSARLTAARPGSAPPPGPPSTPRSTPPPASPRQDGELMRQLDRDEPLSSR